MTELHSTKVVAVVVAYLPHAGDLGSLLTLLVPQVARVLVVDNSPKDDRGVDIACEQFKSIDVGVIRLGRNVGIAKAFNIGIEAAFTAGATHVLLSDQDSQPSPAMVQGLLRAEMELRGLGILLAAVGPSFTNTNNGEIFPFHVSVSGRLFHSRRSATVEEPHVETLKLISSGTLISVAAIKDIGLMREDFFIDGVDTEWCYRARAKGYRLYGTAWATMLHRMGDSSLRVWFFGWIMANTHSPLRIYYQVRNLVRLHYLGYHGVRWRIGSIYSIMAIFYCHVIFGEMKIAALRMASRGLLDGFRGRMGEFKP